MKIIMRREDMMVELPQIDNGNVSRRPGKRADHHYAYNDFGA